MLGYNGRLVKGKNNMITECIIVSKEVDNKFILAKNRDRAYNPKLEIIHTIIDGVGVAYLHDITTDWSEGMNEFGIGLVNSTLLVGHDEAEHKIVKKGGKPSKDGARIRKVLTQKTLKDALKVVLGKNGTNGGIKGHTFVSTPKYMVSVEQTSQHSPKVKLQNVENPIVRTNHGHVFTDAGYTHGYKYLSSKMRKVSAEKQVNKVEDWKEIAVAMRKEFFKQNSHLNMKRDTKEMWTSSQTVLNLTDRIFQLTYFKDKVEEFRVVNAKFTNGYTPKIKIEVISI
jgi:hypothetical protein